MSAPFGTEAANPHLTLIICTFRRPREVRRLLASLDDQARPPNAIWVVDGSPDDETEQAVKRFQARVVGDRAVGDEPPCLQYVRVPEEERGLTRQRNYGIAAIGARAPHDVVAFLDDDTIPAAGYFAEILACFDRHPEAVGVGAALDEVAWRRLDDPAGGPNNGRAIRGVYEHGSWVRREDIRWRLRRAVGLDSTAPPGHMPPAGHARPLSFLPPDGRDHAVEFVMGGAAAWRHGLLEQVRFSPYFAGYGLYEDLDFSLRAGRVGPLFLTTRARARHDHAPTGRPNRFRYGVMVSRNGWLVWRRRWPRPALRDRAAWWSTSLLLAACRLADASRGRPLPALTETAGRVCGLVSLLVRPPEDPHAG